LTIVAGTSEETQPSGDKLPDNPKTGAFASIITALVLLAIFFLIKFRNRSFINKI
jgi:hypothetical protein